MRRLRFFRVLLPVLLLPFLVFVVLQLRPKPPVHVDPLSGSQPPMARGEQVTLTEDVGGRRTLEGEIESVEQSQQDGAIRLEKIHRLVVGREDAAPLIVRADTGGVQGTPGQRQIQLRGGVEVVEEEDGVVVELPELAIDQVAGEARSVGAVALRSPQYDGRAGSVVYGLEGQPTRLTELRIETTEGAVLLSRRAKLNDGTRDMELEGDVRFTRADEYFLADHVRVWRDPQGVLRRVVATGQVSGSLAGHPAGHLRFRAERLELAWDAASEIERLQMSGDALLAQADRSVAASRIELSRSGAALGERKVEGEAAEPADDEGSARVWDLLAEGEVYAEGATGVDRAVLRSGSLQAGLDRDGRLVSALVSGKVDFRTADTWAEAEQVIYVPGATAEEVVLTAAGRRRARIARERTRVAADRIVTDRLGVGLEGTGRVEATLLPADGGRSGPGLFDPDEAVHFVAGRLTGEQSARLLTFEQSVRAWQGNRTLSAERVFVDQLEHDLRAAGDVNTRIPRQDRGAAVSRGDYIHVSAERLDYSDAASRAVYSGDARIRQAEGWLEAQRLEVDLAGRDQAVREVRAFEKILLEYRMESKGKAPRLVTGEGDRAVYTPADALVQLFGDEAAASLRRGEESFSGRLLHYRFDSGTLRVESGEQDAVVIRTSGGNG